METNTLQNQLFSFLKGVLPPHVSLPDELCDLLNISPDSAYRRIRGEKPLAIDELKLICEKFHLSLDQFLNLETETVMFRAPGLNGMEDGLPGYLKGMLQQFHFFNSFKIKEMQYLCKDIPFWYFYLFREMGAFKTFFWTKNIHNDPSLAQAKFSLDEYSYQECFILGQNILKEYNKIPSVELWNLESIHSTINQVTYYRDAGIFRSSKDVELVVTSFHQLLDHLELQSERGVKFLPGAGEVGYGAELQFYINELILGNNTILVSLDNKKVSIITHSVLSYLITMDDRFAEKTFNVLNVLRSRSSMISKTGEKDRKKFFNTLHDKLHSLK